ncbi:MAG TPA: gamma-glutamyltransferase [Candidatus Acidoferrales bacterium]|jgi:gamma-glutamyltranspeptidase/glutathione hydrolase|nr:gamma-glutamyltransferase [Candidatus Acidoferrales bacterium]
MTKPKSQLSFILLAGFLALGMIRENAMAQDRGQGRSMVISQGGIVASESPLASQAGAAILARGGNAVDAAVAAHAVMTVVAPMWNGIGGDLFAIVYDAKSGKYYGLNASGWAPGAQSVERLRQMGLRDMPVRGIEPVTVPGSVDGWQKLLDRFGKKKMKEVLSPAIQVAADGYPVTEWIALHFAANVELLRDNEAAAKTYLISDRAPRLGEVMRNPDLAWSLEQIAAGGRDAFYRGEITKRILALSARHGGALTAKDFSDYSSEWVEPISTTYRGWTVYEMPPNSQGIAALEMLNLMEQFDLHSYGLNSSRALHVQIEAKKLAYADLARYIGDPKMAKLPVTGMLSKSYAAERAKLVNMDHANCDAEPGQPLPSAGDTVYLSVVDREGNMVSFIESNYSEFGSGLVADGTGFVLHNRGALFNLDPASPNAIAGHKRPLHTIIPAFLEKDQTRIAFGIMSGWNQAQAHAQFVSHVVDFNQNIQAALETARFTKPSFGGCDVLIENRLPGNARAELEAKGHKLILHNGFSDAFGGGQAVMRDYASGVNYGASDPRKDGAAIPELTVNWQQ